MGLRYRTGGPVARQYGRRQNSRARLLPPRHQQLRRYGGHRRHSARSGEPVPARRRHPFGGRHHGPLPRTPRKQGHAEDERHTVGKRLLDDHRHHRRHIQYTDARHRHRRRNRAPAPHEAHRREQSHARSTGRHQQHLEHRILRTSDSLQHHGHRHESQGQRPILRQGLHLRSRQCEGQPQRNQRGCGGHHATGVGFLSAAVQQIQHVGSRLDCIRKPPAGERCTGERAGAEKTTVRTLHDGTDQAQGEGQPEPQRIAERQPRTAALHHHRPGHQHDGQCTRYGRTQRPAQPGNRRTFHIRHLRDSGRGLPVQHATDNLQQEVHPATGRNHPVQRRPDGCHAQHRGRIQGAGFAPAARLVAPGNRHQHRDARPGGLHRAHQRKPPQTKPHVRHPHSLGRRRHTERAERRPRLQRGQGPQFPVARGIRFIRSERQYGFRHRCHIGRSNAGPQLPLQPIEQPHLHQRPEHHAELPTAGPDLLGGGGFRLLLQHRRQRPAHP